MVTRRRGHEGRVEGHGPHSRRRPLPGPPSNTPGISACRGTPDLKRLIRRPRGATTEGGYGRHHGLHRNVKKVRSSKRGSADSDNSARGGRTENRGSVVIVKGWGAKRQRSEVHKKNWRGVVRAPVKVGGGGDASGCRNGSPLDERQNRVRIIARRAFESLGGTSPGVGTGGLLGPADANARGIDFEERCC